MAKKKPPQAVSDYMAEIGAKGGKRTGSKGLGAMSAERREEIQAKGLLTRRANAKKRASKRAGK